MFFWNSLSFSPLPYITGKGDMGEEKKKVLFGNCVYDSPSLNKDVFKVWTDWFKLLKPPHLHHLYFWSQVGSSRK